MLCVCACACVHACVRACVCAHVTHVCVCLFLPVHANAELFLSRDDTEKVHDFEEECMEDFFREKENKFQSSSDERVRVINERYSASSFASIAANTQKAQ